VLRALAHPTLAFAVRMTTIAAIILCSTTRYAIPFAEAAFLLDTLATEARERTVVRATADLAAHPGTTAAQIAERLGGGTRAIRLFLAELNRSRIATQSGDNYSLT